MSIFGPNFAERVLAAERIRSMLPLLDRCLAGRYSLKMLVGVRRGIELMADEIRENAVMVVEA
jgi:hypothetical protein